jgi:hypothetical protein
MQNTNTTPVVETPVVTKQKGRPVVEGCVRQQKLAAIAARIAAGETIQRGRPTSSDSARQQKFADKAAKIAAGIKVGPGRPKGTKTEVVAEIPEVMDEVALADEFMEDVEFMETVDAEDEVVF